MTGSADRIAQIAVDGFESALGNDAPDHGVWATARTVYDEAIARPDDEIAKSFFSSITRRVLRTG